MYYIKAVKDNINARMQQNNANKRRETFTKIMVNFGQAVWHASAMNNATNAEKYNEACYHAEELQQCWASFPILFCDLSFDSGNKQYAAELERILYCHGDYAILAASVIKDAREKVRLKIAEHVPPYVHFTVRIDTEGIDDVDCDNETWGALGMFAAYENLLSARPPRHVGEKYLRFMETIAHTKLGIADSVPSESPVLVQGMRTVAICLEDPVSMRSVDVRLNVEQRLQKARAIIDLLPFSASIETWFVLQSGYTHEEL